MDADQNFDTTITQLVSYPRTGSHWLRMILEQYLNKYCLPTSFYNNTEFWGYHLHDRIVGRGDEGVVAGFDKVIYLYRNPVDTIYSQLRYHRIDIHDSSYVDMISHEYYNHLDRWIYNNDDCKEIVFLTYEDIKNNFHDTIKKVLTFLDCEYDKDSLQLIFNRLSLENAKNSIQDKNVIDKGHFNGEYEYSKDKFIKLYKGNIDMMFKKIWK